MDLAKLIDMSYFWWAFNKVVAFAIVFLIIFIAIQAAGWLLETLISAFRNMRKG
ncbi:hypothetical protein WJ0W_007176 [Paenibacillus melissococcoides]|uniref:Uncharacterized protein n=1 Tax=Paenibacillus melissococcoides TaxID=2912268 RepID=A0ABM9G932_9BACL|nr:MULTISPECIES: hypothetical protein [Paenibacillus]GIO81883.1 hypothetical protein J6TS7_54930 [Paenibacillus dendritiformis]CAH8248508.1 hypothetical protein WJ0W_007176 [Paenibacillus melissococcoides]CAH8722012.1 hypothetical protein HTL2_006649 [Paenibacillus melissococcoides]CAH8722048.1 hypothetical protein WDD9_006595 [Paenibacillus melissococcoides]